MTGRIKEIDRFHQIKVCFYYYSRRFYIDRNDTDCVPIRHQDRLRARRLTPSQITMLEEAWKARPEARVEDLAAAPLQQEADPVALRYEVRNPPCSNHMCAKCMLRILQLPFSSKKPTLWHCDTRYVTHPVVTTWMRSAC